MRELLALLLLVLALAIPYQALARPLAVYTQPNGVKITLYTDPCELPKDKVSNQPLRARWDEPGGSFEGCWRATFRGILILLYFADGSVEAVMSGAFAHVEGVSQ